jgi:threonine aldolase
MAKLLEQQLKDIPEVTITQKVDANGVFAIFSKHCIDKVQDHFFFYVWNEKTNEVRLMCSFDTTEEEVVNFGKLVKEAVKN